LAWKPTTLPAVVKRTTINAGEPVVPPRAPSFAPFTQTRLCAASAQVGCGDELLIDLG